MGINIADAIFEQDDIYGDGVNIAARLQTYSEPGGIVVSGAVADQISEQAGVSAVDLGDLHLRNLSRPVKAFGLRIERAERWLSSRSRDPELLATLGRLCCQAELWGKAKSFLEASLSFEETRSAHLERTIEPFRQIDRIADRHDARRHLVGPDFEQRELGWTVGGRERAIDRIVAAGNFHAADSRHVEARIISVPASAEKDFAIRVEIHRRARIDVTDIGQVAGHVARG